MDVGVIQPCAIICMYIFLRIELKSRLCVNLVCRIGTGLTISNAMYSGTPLKWPPSGPGSLAIIEGWP